MERFRVDLKAILGLAMPNQHCLGDIFGQEIFMILICRSTVLFDDIYAGQVHRMNTMAKGHEVSRQVWAQSSPHAIINLLIMPLPSC